MSHAVIGEYSGNPEPFLSPGSLGENTGSFEVLLLSGPQEKRLRPQAKTYQPWILADGMKHSLSLQPLWPLVGATTTTEPHSSLNLMKTQQVL